ncbi:hypothetical protein Tco_0629692 [Tanacetum coccineum]|uniref:Uncharacterized protein n=1 Tax=Tanacetum coccineum TaxID=301880 RepID=A0ABQ4WTX2_9ASTR
MSNIWNEVDMGSQAEASSSSKRDMGSYISTMKPSDVKALTRKYKIPRDLHLVAVFRDGPMVILTGIFIFFTKDDYRGQWEALTEQDVIPQHTTTPLSADEQVPEKTDSQQRVEDSDPKIVATRIRKANAAAKRKQRRTGSLKVPWVLRGFEESGDNAISPTQTQGDNLVEIPAHDSANTITRPYEEHHDEHSGVLGNKDGNFDDDVDEELDIGGPGGHVSDTSERVVIETESIPTAATRPDNGKSIAQEETPMPDPLPKGVIGADGAGSSLPLSLFVPTWGIHQRSRVTTPEECRDLMVNLIPPGVREEMNLLDNNVVLDRAWFSLARGAMETPRGAMPVSEGLAVVRAEKNSLMATNAEQTLWIKELEQQFKSVHEVHYSAVKDLESQLAQKDSALVYAERISDERLSENEGLRAQLAFAQKEKTDAIRKLLPTVVWLKKRSRKEAHKIIEEGMNGFDPYSDKKMTVEYERLFSKTYLYVYRISHLSKKPVQDLLKLHPAPPPKDAPKASFGGIAFALKLVRAAEVASSKDTASKEFSRSKTGPFPQDPASKHVSGGSKTPPSKKT